MDGIAAIRRWWWVLLLGAVVAGAVAYGLASTIEKSYTAQARLLVGPISGDKDTLEAAGQLARTYAELATSEPLVEHVIRQTGGGRTADDVIDQMSTASNDINRIVSVSVTDKNADRAVQLANGVGTRLRQISGRTPAADLTAIDSLMRQPEIQRLPGLERAGIQEAAGRVLTASPAGRIQVVEPASRPTSPSAPRVGLLTALAALAGLIATALVVFLRAAAAESQGVPRDLADVADAPFLGAVETAPGRGLQQNVRQSYRVLAGRSGLLATPPAARSLLMLDVGEGRAAATAALNLGLALADDGVKVMLIDASLDDATMTRLRGLGDRLGYGDLLAQGVAPNRKWIDALMVDSEDGLKVLPRGRRSPERVIDLDHARAILKAASAEGEIVIISAASIHRSPATLSWARAVDENLIVVDAAQGDSRQALDEIVQTLSGLGASTLGTVLSRPAEGHWWRLPGRGGRRAAA